MPLEISRFFRDFSRFSVLNKSCILQWENGMNSRGKRFFDKILNKSCILQWENVVEIFLESGDFVANYYESNCKSYFRTNFASYFESNFES